MATIVHRFTVPIAAAEAWQVIAAFENPQDLAPGFVTACTSEKQGAVRHVTFANGASVQERLVTLDHDARCLVYAAFGGSSLHHNAAMRVHDCDGRAEIEWTTHVLPDAMAPAIRAMMNAGAAAIRAGLADS